MKKKKVTKLKNKKLGDGEFNLNAFSLQYQRECMETS